MSLRETVPLQKIKILKRSMSGILSVFIVGLITAGVLYMATSDFAEQFEDKQLLGIIKAIVIGIYVLIVVMNAIWTPIYNWLYWKRYFYDMDDNNIVIRKGVIAQKESTLPFSRITDVYVDQDMFDVIFGLYDVHISTPTQQSGEFAHIDGVNKKGSQTLRQMLLDRINKEES